MQFRFFLIFLPIVTILSCAYSEGSLVFTPVSFFPKISTYGIMLAIAFLVSNYLVQKEFPRVGYSLKVGEQILIAGMVGGIIGAKIFYVLESYSSIDNFSKLGSYLFSGGGLTWYGGFIVASIAIIYILWRNRIPILQGIDLLTPMLAIGYVFGRMGCIVSGDGCYGEACTMNWPAPFCMAFPNGAASWADFIKVQGKGDPNVTAINTPFFEASFSLLLFIFFWAVRKKEWPNGIKFQIYIFLHAMFRFSVEIIRLNPRDVFGVSQAQFISIILMTISFMLGVYLFFRGKTTRPA